MENKIQELTDKIYREGVEKGNEEAAVLLRMLRKKLKKLLKKPIKKLNQLLPPLVNLPMN